MPTVGDMLAQAVRYHQGGAWQQAEALYRQVLQVEPNQPDALHLLGVLASQAGRHDVAVAYIRQALTRAPGAAVFHCHLGIAYQRLGRLDEAMASYRQAIELKPDFAEAVYNLGTAQQDQGKLAEALVSFGRALQLKADYVDALINQGVVLAASRRFEEAATSYEHALRFRPDSAEALNNLGNARRELGRLDDAETSLRAALRVRPDYADAHFNLGNVLQDKRRLQEAASCFRTALHFQPNYPQAWNNLGNILHILGRLDEAQASLQQALRLKADHAEALYNLGNVFRDQGKLEEAAASFREAIRVRPDFVLAYDNLGNVLQAQAKLEAAAAAWQAEGPPRTEFKTDTQNRLLQEAVSCYDRALRLQPDNATAHFNRALAWLLQGDFRRGWKEYEWRWQCPEFTPPSFAQPLWDGSPLGSRSILLHAEQGLGDTIQFIRYAPLLARQGGRVLVRCQARLLPLLSRCPGIDVLVDETSEPPPFDVHAPLMSLPYLCGTTLETIPAEVPYLFPDESLIEGWRTRLANIEGFRIGICWHGNPKHKDNTSRSFPLAALEPLARVPGVRLISLQQGDGVEQLGPNPSIPVVDLGPGVDRAAGAFMDTAAVIKGLDLVVTADTALAHLAGSLGAPLWIALSATAEWRWLLGRRDSPWYPSARLFRQPAQGDWAAVFAAIAGEVTGLTMGRSVVEHPGVGNQHEQKK